MPILMRWQDMNSDEPIVALALLSQRELERLGDGLQRVYPLESGSQFSELLAKLDQIAWPHPD
jgi:hypothetical protein